jgi:hypothetical protein
MQYLGAELEASYLRFTRFPFVCCSHERTYTLKIVRVDRLANVVLVANVSMKVVTSV